MVISIYLIIAIVCAILLIVMAALGGFGGAHDMDMGGHDMDMGHYDAGHGDYSGSHLSPLSIPVLLAFGTTFGAVGAIMEDLGQDSLITIVVAIVFGVVMAGGMYALVYYMIFKSQATTQMKIDDMVGLSGLLTVGIKGGEPGQVVLNTEKRGRVPVPATAKADIESNSTVKVIGISGNAVIVEKEG
jgi:hypothetical protein